MDEPKGYRKPPEHIRTYGDVIRLCRSMFPDTGWRQRFKFACDMVNTDAGPVEKLFFINNYGQQVLICLVDIPTSWRGPCTPDFISKWGCVLSRRHDEMVRLTEKMEAAIARAKQQEHA